MPDDADSKAIATSPAATGGTAAVIAVAVAARSARRDVVGDEAGAAPMASLPPSVQCKVTLSFILVEHA